MTDHPELRESLKSLAGPVNHGGAWEQIQKRADRKRPLLGLWDRTTSRVTGLRRPLSFCDDAVPAARAGEGSGELKRCFEGETPVLMASVPKVSGWRRSGSRRVVVLASIAAVLVAVMAVGILEAVEHLRNGNPAIVITDDTVGMSPASSGRTTQTTVAAGIASYPITALAADPRDPSVVYAGSRWNGASLYVSADAGATWELLRDFGAEMQAGPHDPSIDQLIIDPDQPSRMYVGLRDERGDYHLMQSSDGGATWTPLEHAEQLWIDPSSSSTLYVSVDDGLSRSTEDGATWTALDLPGVGGIWSLVIDPHDSSVLYAKLRTGGLFRSGDGGATWQDITDRLPGLVETPDHLDRLGPLSLAIDPLDGRTVCALPHKANLGYVFPPFDERTSIGLTQGAELGYVSTDRGATWSRLGDAALLALKARLKAAPGTPVAALLAAAGFLESYTRGLSVEFEPSLTESATGTVATVATHFIIDPGNPLKICVGTDHGVFLSIDGGATWTMSNAGLPLDESATGKTTTTSAQDVTTIEAGLPSDGQVFVTSVAAHSPDLST